MLDDVMTQVSSPTPEIFSTDVQLTLRTKLGDFSLGQIAPGYIILDPPHQLPSGPAEVILSIDGRDRTWAVELPEGSSLALSRTTIRRL